MKYVIIGNSAAAVGCVEGIRQIDTQGKILIITDELAHAYSRPLISYLMQGKTDEQRMKYRPDGFYEENGCEVMAGVAVTSIDAKGKTVQTSDGRAISYDRLLVATGSRPFVPPANGYDGVEKKFTFMTLADARALQEAVTPESRVLIVGAGLIGLKCAEGIHGRAKRITVVDLADRVLPSILDEAGSDIVKLHIRERGVVFRLGDCVERFEGGVAYLRSGRELEFDILVMAAGVKPNTDIFPGKVNRGIAVDSRCRTSEPDVYAAGDCAESYDITSGMSRVLALLPNAYMQGECAGVNMAGGDAEYTKAIPMNAIGFFGLHMITAGSYEGDAYTEQNGKDYKKLVTAGGLMNGFILIGNVQRAGIYTSLIRGRRPLSEIDYDLIKTKPQLMAFSKKERGRQLGGAV